jgi:quercetin dioxygenase-like cupin family protein
MRSSRTWEHAGAVESRVGATFSGPVWGEVLLPHLDGVGVNRVTFGPGSRTFWHRHAGGQILHGLAGSGLVVARSGQVARISPGVIVHSEGDEEHWHGALPEAFLTHLSVALGGATTWLDEVGADEYRAAVQAAVLAEP